MTRMWMESRDYNADRATFDTRLEDHLQEWRNNLRKLALRRIYESGHDKVAFTASNPTDAPIRNVEIVATFKPGDALVLTSHPGNEMMPPMPKWPDISDDLVARYGMESGIARMAAAYALPAPTGARMRIEKRNDGEYLEIAFLVGDVRAHRSVSTPEITIIPRMAFDIHALNVAVTATAMDRRGAAQDQFVIAIADEGFPIDAFVEPDYWRSVRRPALAMGISRVGSFRVRDGRSGGSKRPCR